MAPPGAGYSGTPLSQKLGLKPGHRMLLIGAPKGFRELLEPLPEGVHFATRGKPPFLFVHLFASRLDDLDRLKTLREELDPGGVLWVSWPKKSSGVETDVSEDGIRAAALPLGLVDVKVCAVDATWSGLKLMIRRSARANK